MSITSLPDFNHKIWGLKRGLTVVGGRTSMGKSSLVLQMAYDLADQQKEVLFLSLEMTTENLVERLFCNIQRVDNFDMLTGKLKTETIYQEKWGQFEKLMNIPLKISCGLGKTFDDINDLIEILDPKPKAIFVDYVQAIRKTTNERLEMDDYIIRFREICLKNNIAGVLVSQNSRKVFDEESKEPSLANLKSTGALEEVSDTVLLVFWPHFYNERIDRNIYKIIIAKQRNGRTGDYLVNYIPEYYRFTELSLEQKENLNKQKTTQEKVKEIFNAD
jgi:replicative DNA helicase